MVGGDKTVTVPEICWPTHTLAFVPVIVAIPRDVIRDQHHPVGTAIRSLCRGSDDCAGSFVSAVQPPPPKA
jgi:hypothetical protein